jgi:hypothetical protein
MAFHEALITGYGRRKEDRHAVSARKMQRGSGTQESNQGKRGGTIDDGKQNRRREVRLQKEEADRTERKERWRECVKTGQRSHRI